MGLCLLACAHGAKATKPTFAPHDVAVFYPLAVGNQWTYQVQLLGEHQQRTFKIVAERDGFYEDDTGVRLRADAYGIRDEKRYLLQGPLEAGRTWESQVGLNSLEHYRILKAYEPCQAPAGKFDLCIEVESLVRKDPETSVLNVMTFARDVGIVRIQTFMERRGVRTPQAELALLRYEVAPLDAAQPLPK